MDTGQFLLQWRKFPVPVPSLQRQAGFLEEAPVVSSRIALITVAMVPSRLNTYKLRLKPRPGFGAKRATNKDRHHVMG